MKLTINTIDEPTFKIFREKVKFSILFWNRERNLVCKRDWEDSLAQILLHYVQLDPLFARIDAPNSKILKQRKAFVFDYLTTPIPTPVPLGLKTLEFQVGGRRPIEIYVNMLLSSQKSHNEFHHICFELYVLPIYMVNSKPPSL